MASNVNDNVDYRLLNRLSSLVICSRCLRSGKITPVPQVMSDRRALTNVCQKCRNEISGPGDRRGSPGKLLSLTR